MKKALLFDFDGVLVNTAEIWYSVYKESNPNLEYTTFQAMSDGNFIEAVRDGIQAGTFVLDPDYKNKYHAKLTEEKVQEALGGIIRKFSNSHKIFIVSSGSEDVIKDYLRSQELLEHFTQVLGYESHLSKEEKIKHILNTHIVEPHDAVMITDTSGDVLEAKPTGVKTIGVLWGLHDEEMLRIVNPEKIVKTPSELEMAIEELLQ